MGSIHWHAGVLVLVVDVLDVVAWVDTAAGHKQSKGVVLVLVVVLLVVVVSPLQVLESGSHFLLDAFQMCLQRPVQS